MRVSSATLRNVLAGTVIAGVISFATAELLAGACGASTLCQQGQLQGYWIECSCAGEGQCQTITPGYRVVCACEGFDITYCDCDNGCN
jgi:hypothetical protein